MACADTTPRLRVACRYDIDATMLTLFHAMPLITITPFVTPYAISLPPRSLPPSYDATITDYVPRHTLVLRSYFITPLMPFAYACRLLPCYHALHIFRPPVLLLRY